MSDQVAPSKGAWTPGPWELDSAKDGDSRYQIIHGQLPKGINGDFGYPVADSMNRHHCIAPEEDRANGLLLSKAPQMAELLRELVKVIQSVTEIDDSVCYFNGRYMGNLEKPLVRAESLLTELEGKL